VGLSTAAIVTIGSELTQGLRIDTNTSEIARALTPRGFDVHETVSVGDDVTLLTMQIARLVRAHRLVITTGGLGPTHDDITRSAAAAALNLELEVDDRLVAWLKPVMARHKDPEAAAQVLVQAEVLHGARVIDASTGTAPGLVVDTPAGALALLPGPPSEMRPMLSEVLSAYPLVYAPPRELGVVGLTESDAQMSVQRALGLREGIGFTILARPGDVRVLLTDQGAGAAELDSAVADVAKALDERCYSDRGHSLAQTIIEEAARRGLTIGLAESCTGGMVAAALTDTAGASSVLMGSAVTYSNEAKTRLLGVAPALIAEFGAVSEQCVAAMAEGALRAFGADIAVSVSGIAGPDGGSAEKPVGTVWFGIRGPGGDSVIHRCFPGGSREAVRLRATSFALDLLRRQVFGLSVNPA